MLWKYCTNLGYSGVHARTADGQKISPGAPGHNEPYCRWDTALHYHQFVEEKATTPLPDGTMPSLALIRNADEKTRLYWQRMTGPDCPARVTLNVAIKRSLTECHHYWNWPANPLGATPPPGKRGRDAADTPGNANLPPAKIAKKCSM